MLTLQRMQSGAVQRFAQCADDLSLGWQSQEEGG